MIENVMKLFRDIFSMDFDVIIPVSGSIIAVMVGDSCLPSAIFPLHIKEKNMRNARKNPRQIHLR